MFVLHHDNVVSRHRPTPSGWVPPDTPTPSISTLAFPSCSSTFHSCSPSQPGRFVASLSSMFFVRAWHSGSQAWALLVALHLVWRVGNERGFWLQLYYNWGWFFFFFLPSITPGPFGGRTEGAFACISTLACLRYFPTFQVFAFSFSPDKYDAGFPFFLHFLVFWNLPPLSPERVNLLPSKAQLCWGAGCWGLPLIQKSQAWALLPMLQIGRRRRQETRWGFCLQLFCNWALGFLATALLWLLSLKLCCIIFGVIEEWLLESESKDPFLSSSFALFVLNVKARPYCGREPWKDLEICY